MGVRLLALGLLLVVLWTLFRFAMGLRAAKVEREAARRAAEDAGRRVVTELPEPAGVRFFIEDAGGFSWGEERVGRGDVLGARLLLNGGVMAAFGEALPDAPPPEEFEGRERWDVVLYLRDGRTAIVACGTVREGVSREAAARVFAAVRRGDGDLS